MAKVKKVKVPPVALLTHSPSPGLYSRLERAVEQLPEVVKIEGLENRLKKFKEGVAGWEMQPVMEAVAMRDILGEHAGNPRKDITRKELLELVREYSPAFTHTEKVLTDNLSGRSGSGRLGDPLIENTRTQWHGIRETAGENYREHLLGRSKLPDSKSGLEQWSGGHWSRVLPGTYAHMRTIDAGDAVRLQELQSDVVNQNQKFKARTGQEQWDPQQFPLYHHYPEVLLKSLLLNAAKDGKRAIEIPSISPWPIKTNAPEGVVRQVYGQTTPNTLMRIARPLGGLVDGTPLARLPDEALERERAGLYAAEDAKRDLIKQAFYDLVQRVGLSPTPPHAFDEGRRTFLNLIGDGPFWGGGGRPLDGRLRPEEVEQLRDAMAQSAAEDRVLSQVNDRRRATGKPEMEWHQLNWDNKALQSQHAIAKEQVLSQLEQHRGDIARELEAARELAQRQDELHDERLALPDPVAGLEAPSRRLEISDDLRRKLIQGGIGLSVLAGANAASDQGEAQAGMMDFFKKAATGQQMSRREFLRGSAQAAAAAAASRIPVPSALTKAGSQAAPIENLSPNEWKELPQHMNSGFRFLGDGTVNFYPHNHGPVGIGGDWVGANGTPPMWVDPPSMFDEVTQKEADDFLQKIRNVNFSVPGNDTDPATGLAHSQYRFNRKTGQWHPHYVREVRPNVFRDVYLEPGAPRPVELPQGIIDPIQRAYEDNPLWMHEEWPEWTTQGKEMLLDQRQRWLNSMAEDWRQKVESDPESHRQSMENDPEYRKSYEQAMEQVSRVRGGRQNLGPQPAAPDAMQLTGNMGLPGDTPTERIGRIRRLLSMGVPLAAATALASSQAQAGEPDDMSAEPVEGSPGKFLLPKGIDIAPRGVPSPDEQRMIPVSGMDAEDSDILRWRDAKVREMERPTINQNGTLVSPAAFAKDALTAEAVRLWMDGEPSFDPQVAYAKMQNLLLGIEEPQQDDANVAVVGWGAEDEQARAVLANTMNAIAANTPGGPDSDQTGIQAEELDRLSGKHGTAANFMYDRNSRRNFEALRQHELLMSGLPEIEGLQPLEAGGNASKVLRAIGAPFDADTMRMAKQDFAAATGFMPQQKATAQQALYWYDKSKPTRDAEGYDSFRDNWNGSKYQRYSTTTMSGLMGGLGEDASRAYGRMSQYMLPASSDPSLPKETRGFLSQIRSDSKRPVPVVRPGLTPEETRKFAEVASQYGDKSDAWLSAKIAQITGAHPTGFADAVLNSPRYLADVANIVDMAATGGVGGVGTIRKMIGKPLVKTVAGTAAGMAKPVVRNVGEESLQEGIFGTAATPALGQSVMDFGFKSPEYNALAEDEDGKQVNPMADVDRYRRVTDRNWREAVDAVNRAAQSYNRMRSPVQKPY